jgi:diaminopropionate ammonia-lyase
MTDLRRHHARHVRNALARRDAPFGEAERRVLGLDAIRAARAEIETWPGYAPTPLRPLPGLAARLGLGAVLYKDEGQRFGLGSFKALGGAYAVLRLLQRHLRERHGVEADAQDLLAGGHRELAREVTVATATDGNHGRSVAWGAERFGARCVVYIHEHVSPARERAIARYGAEVRRVPGGYDDSVRRCAADAAANGWRLVADTSAEGGGWEVPSMVMQGYGLLALEALEQAGGEEAPPFTHAFVQAGVGGLAAAVAAVVWQLLGPGRPRIVVVEPERADCVFRTVAAGRPTPVPGEADTFMACLAAGEVSPAAWEILRTAADDVLALPDEAAGSAMRALAGGVGGDRPVVAGESGCAAAAGLVAAALDPALREALALDSGSRVLVIGSEGATDALTYERTVGRPAEAVEAA